MISGSSRHRRRATYVEVLMQAAPKCRRTGWLHSATVMTIPVYTNAGTAERYAALDGLRGIAALLVVASHLGNAGMPLVPGLDFSGTGK